MRSLLKSTQLGSIRTSPRTSLRRSGSGCSSGAQDRPSESSATVGSVINEERRLDELQLHDSQHTLVVRNNVDADVGRLGGRSSERPLRQLDCAGRRSIAVERLASVIFLHPEIAGARTLDDGMAVLTIEQHQREFAGPRNLLDERLDDHWPTEALQWNVVARPEEVRAHGARGNRRLYHQSVTTEAAARFLEIAIAA